MTLTPLARCFLSISLCCLLLILGCTDHRPAASENDLKDLSRHAVSLNTSNRFTLYPLIENKLETSSNPEFHRSVFEIAMTLDTLAMKCIEQTGGIAENGTMMNPSESGEKGMQLYQELNTKEKLSSLINKAKLQASPADKKLMQATEYMLHHKFLSDEPYFNSDRLTHRPLSVLSLELMILENQLCSILLKEMTDNNR